MHEENDYITNRLSSLKKSIDAQEQLLRLHTYSVGVLDCIGIMKLHMKIRELDIRQRDLTTEMEAQHIIGRPLMGVTTRSGEKYNIVLTRIDRLISGEHETIEDLLSKLNINDIDTVENDLEILSNIVIDNSIRLYESIKSSVKHTPKGKKFRGLNTSGKRKYLYYYPGDKKKSIGFIALKCTLVNY